MLLRDCSQEGIWIPEVHGRAATRVMEIEEEGISCGSPGLLPVCADVYESRRVHGVALNVDKTAEDGRNIL